MKVFKKEQSVIEKEIEDIDVKLKTVDPHTQGAEYEQLLHIRGQLKEQADVGILKRVSPDMWAKIGASVLLAGMVMTFESFGHVFTSKGASFLPKIL